MSMPMTRPAPDRAGGLRLPLTRSLMRRALDDLPFGLRRQKCLTRARVQGSLPLVQRLSASLMAAPSRRIWSRVRITGVMSAHDASIRDSSIPITRSARDYAFGSLFTPF